MLSRLGLRIRNNVWLTTIPVNPYQPVLLFYTEITLVYNVRRRLFPNNVCHYRKEIPPRVSLRTIQTNNYT